jgi:hypothetical protein
MTKPQLTKFQSGRHATQFTTFLLNARHKDDLKQEIEEQNKAQQLTLDTDFDKHSSEEESISPSQKDNNDEDISNTDNTQ